MTIYRAASLKEELMALLEKGPQLAIDLSRVSELDTAGLQLLIMAKNEAVARGGELQLQGHSPAVLNVLDLCNMANFFGDPVVLPSKAHP